MDNRDDTKKEMRFCVGVHDRARFITSYALSIWVSHTSSGSPTTLLTLFDNVNYALRVAIFVYEVLRHLPDDG